MKKKRQAGRQRHTNKPDSYLRSQRKALRKSRPLSPEAQASASVTSPLLTGNGVGQVPYDENLMERCRTQWQFGDWDRLAKLDREVLQHHPDRDKLALLAAAACLQTNDPATARQLIRLARTWGCSKQLISRVLISGVHNSLGCYAALSGQTSRAKRHFEGAIAIGSPGGEARLIAHARTERQLAQLGLIEKSAGRLQAQKVLVSAAAAARDAGRQPNGAPSPVYSHEGYEHYRTLSALPENKESPPFVMLDSKSLPRSGLHYLKNTFSSLLGENFSFCEWYQEPGCCKKMPCALTGFPQYCKQRQMSGLRLVKSHDLRLDDPVFEPMSSLRRVILIRSPLYSLTSWFALDQLHKHKPVLQRVGINMEKIWAAHEPEILTVAYRALDEAFQPPSVDMISAWLSEKAQYIAGFIEKWVRPALESHLPFTYVVRYEDINLFIATTLANLKAYLPIKTQILIDEFARNGTSRFLARQDPFVTPSEKLSAYLMDNADIFNNISRNIVNRSPMGVFDGI